MIGDDHRGETPRPGHRRNRSGYVCGGNECWGALGEPPGDPDHKGYKYKDGGGAADGVRLVKLQSGAAGASKALAKGTNKASASPKLPTGVASALAGSGGVTVQIAGSNSPACLSVDLPTVVKDEGNRFKAKQ